MSYSRKQAMLLVVLVVALAVHAASLCVFVRHYAASSVFEFGHGYATVYWGGDREMRNSYIFNVGEWPLRTGTVFAGQDWPEGMRWEIYSDEWKFFSADMQHKGFLRVLGYSLPQWRHDNGAASILIPLGSLMFIFEAGILIFWLINRADLWAKNSRLATRWLRVENGLFTAGNKARFGLWLSRISSNSFGNIVLVTFL